ncbi:hypothetical protein Rsub_07446 [Raphidocelis subcapitata]|uniref:Uncharacterized protein n=1 Tax=Raphidocelis subcapitata TaxID=307507 RepID=A0A2V0PCW6_9CHLO|nr:hypothetical protein Rsub_07446 [Raphidocelis subcapitata]|eukprot:GBF94945.1 hypothetical protein Rsub_07446 [Raphidocelis subcapitata]
MTFGCARRGGPSAAAAAAPPAPRRPAAALLLLVALALALAAAPPAAAQPPPGAPSALVEVSTPEQLLAALTNGTAGQIHLVKPMVLPEGWGPARVARPLLVMSPYRVVLDWPPPAPPPS